MSGLWLVNWLPLYVTKLGMLCKCASCLRHCLVAKGSVNHSVSCEVFQIWVGRTDLKTAFNELNLVRLEFYKDLCKLTSR